ncbi:hypothetical protein DFW101_1751 [Solidesulfovibrio carbinoliphilus subsp. oakridgensis]|uniref:Uncharacterized protein n=1 Tax=Solidesulfovibrio carbinoliphilus subsp. oakridgensis TaxID=694327 RepID=G7Q937_9BACT|nr:hypothetical protein [Solidesulfovibrio carbinoliphilus]EHJ47759.1 hypothetical protein DFW101_1751 [Solidesulfovibrio carbinoliphilus subsp. oakridgensis]
MTGTDETDIAAKEAELSARMEALAARKAVVEKQVRELMAAEDHKAGISHAQAIFAAKQEKLALETELEIARRQKKRLTMSF